MVTCVFVRLFFYQCWPDGPLDTNVDFDFHRLSFYLQNECLCQTSVSHENHLIFMRMTVQVTYIFIPIVSLKDSFCQSGKSKLGIGLFIHELLREPLIIHFSHSVLPLCVIPAPLYKTAHMVGTDRVFVLSK